MTVQTKKCAECGKDMGSAVKIDIYKHTVTCFHLPDIGKDQILKLYGAQTSEYAKRIVKNLSS